jgi:hypothetical protein
MLVAHQPHYSTPQKCLQNLRDVPGKDEGIYSLTAGVALGFMGGGGLNLETANRARSRHWWHGVYRAQNRHAPRLLLG